jgi:hypothetical protein
MLSNDPFEKIFTISDEIVLLNKIPLRFFMIEADIPKIKRYYHHLIQITNEDTRHTLRKMFDLTSGGHCAQRHYDLLEKLLHSPDLPSEEYLLKAKSE